MTLPPAIQDLLKRVRGWLETMPPLPGGLKLWISLQSGICCFSPSKLSKLTRLSSSILLQSLTNCLATCKTHAAKPSAKCPDCDAAKAVKAKLQKQVKA